MAAAAKGEATDKAKAAKGKKDRGTQDELEVLRQIVMESTPIRTVVMERMRQVKARVAAAQGRQALDKANADK